MPTLLEALSDGSYDLQNKRDTSSDFSKKLIKYRDLIVSDYLKYNIDLSKAISKIAQKDQLNDDQIKRIIEEVNNQVYLIKYDKLKGTSDREVVFDIASFKKVKNLADGVEEVIPADNDKKDNNDSKDNHGGVEKKASFQDSFLDSIESDFKANIFNGVSYRHGSLAPEATISKEEVLLKKIAQKLIDKEGELEKIAKDISSKTSLLADAVVKYARMQCDTSEILSSIAKKANLNDDELTLIKNAVEDKVDVLKYENSVPENFKVAMEVSFEKTASEKFTLGKYSSLNKKDKLEKIALYNGKAINSYDDLAKIATELKDNLLSLKTGNDEFSIMRDKVVLAGVTDDVLSKVAANTSFFVQC